MKVSVKFNDYSNAIIECERDIFMELREYYSFETEGGARFNPKFKYSGWDGRIRLLQPDGKFPYGLVNNLEKYCARNEYEFEKEEDFTPISHFTSREEFDKWLADIDIYSGGNKITAHWYQADAVYYAIQNNRGILNLPTSAGKSLIAALICYWYMTNYDGKILLIVPTTSLVTQMMDDFADYQFMRREFSHGIMAGKTKDHPAPVFVSTWQSASKQPVHWFRQFGALLIDECHNVGSEIKNIITNLSECPFKWGMSGSLKDGKCNIMSYVGLFGDVFKPVSTKQLMEEGQVTDLKINNLFLRYPKQDCVLTKGIEYQQEIKYIEEHTKRNAFVCRLALKLAKEKKENTLILFRHKEHGKKLYEALSKKHDNVFFANGDTNVEERDQLKKIAEGSDGMIIVASIGIFSTGISIKKLFHVIFASPFKSKVTTLQSIGRVLRKHGEKTIATLWDIVDNLCIETKNSKPGSVKYAHKNYAYKHAMLRIERYASEMFDYQIKEILL
ncbi:DNA helicase [Aeromonas phage CC2]|uniref:RNA-DNA and DNA-DNA helicase/ATPase n=1 Tax=Aeromonas phage CC2 TaxID=1204516 RepID=I6XLX8_9CAUD|nr:DNA helicase [Aeromonas phage CC2]AFN39534.1 RNA-DNA and DNA-DNA helicase/ATPase [Aeromonas phage CC2]